MVRTRASKLLLSGDVSTSTASGHLHKRWRRVKKGVEGSVQNLYKPLGKSKKKFERRIKTHRHFDNHSQKSHQKVDQERAEKR